MSDREGIIRFPQSHGNVRCNLAAERWRHGEGDYHQVEQYDRRLAPSVSTISSPASQHHAYQQGRAHSYLDSENKVGTKENYKT